MSEPSGLIGEPLSLGVSDARRCVAYLFVPESDEYIAVMEVFESSVTDLTPAEVTASMMAAGLTLPAATVENGPLHESQAKQRQCEVTKQGATPYEWREVGLDRDTRPQHPWPADRCGSRAPGRPGA